eukprot:scaffold3214_cov113-Cylindrotheca_fusiformis.AAC.4
MTSYATNARTPRIQLSLPKNLCSSDSEEEAELDYGSSPSCGQNRNTSASSATGTLMEPNGSLVFPINVECTSLCLAPSGNFLWAGFSDGTLRDAAVAFRQKSTMLVASKWCQTYGAVACQIHARGVHTDLLTQVNICEDYVFCGVNRGAMDLYAVSTSDLEANVAHPQKQNILDYLDVHVHADAKLKGLGACTKLRTSKRPTFLLLTGKGIKNIHIWSFQPPLAGEEEPIWTQLYDTQTNGNTINLLGFYRSPKTNKLLGISKSGAQKLRLWDLSAEEGNRRDEKRPKRPPYVDVANSEAALGVTAGGFCVCGGPTMYNQLSIVSLDQPKNAYNHTELALPSASVKGGEMGSRRQRRGDLKQVVNVASPPPGDANEGQMLLELDDGSIVQHIMSLKGMSRLEVLKPPEIPALPDDYWKRTICLASSKTPTSVVVAMSLYNPNTQKGQLVLRTLDGVELAPPSPMQTDKSALQSLCMEAPPSSALKKSKKAKKKKKREEAKEQLKSMDVSSSESCASTNSKKKSTSISNSKQPPCTSLLPQPKKKKRKEKPEAVTIPQESPVFIQKPKTCSSLSLTGEQTRNFKETPLHIQKQKTSLSFAGEHIRVKKMKVIPMNTPANRPMKKLSYSDTPNAGTKKAIQYSHGNKLQVIPISANKNDNETRELPGFETPTPALKKSTSYSIATTVSNTKYAMSAQQVSPESAMSRQSSQSIPQVEVKQTPQPNREQLKSPPVPRKPRQDDPITPGPILPEPEINVESKAASSDKVLAGKKRPRTPPPTILETAKRESRQDAANTLIDMRIPAAQEQAPVTPENGQSRQEVIAMKLRNQFGRIQGLIKELPPFQPAFLRKASPKPKSLEEAQVMARSKLGADHRASHERIRKCMLRSAESTIRNAMDSYLSIEDARNELKETIKSYHEVVYDTLQRQKLEASTLAAEQARSRGGLDVPTTEVSFPFHSTFTALEEIRIGIEAPRRPPGRPRSS